jgi:putative sigma-54 modulation protein
MLVAKGSETRGGVGVQVKGKNVSITPNLRDQVIKKMSRLDKYLDRLHDIEVELCHEKTREASRQNQVEATTYVAGRTIRVTANDSDMLAAVDTAVDRLYRQLNRKKEQMKGHRGSKLAESLPELMVEDTLFEGELEPERSTEEPEIYVERLDVKPQFEDEAIAAMEASGRDFYVFLNARSEHLNVLYRRDDGVYGLIDPHRG